MAENLSPHSTIVIGHRNPDTDSICSAIAYANLKNQISDLNCVPCRAGEISNETRFVLERFGVDIPLLCQDVSPQVQDVEFRRMEGVDGQMSLKRAWEKMRDDDVSTLPIVSSSRHLLGLITVADIATANMDNVDMQVLARSHTSYRNILDTLDATMVLGDADSCVDSGRVIIGAGNPDVLEDYLQPGDIVILSNRYESQLCAIEMNAGCLIICNNAKIPKTIYKLAEEEGCKIISTPLDTYAAAIQICLSAPISYFMVDKKLSSFRLDTPLEDVQHEMAKVRHRYFPILDNDGLYCGMISRRNLMTTSRKKMILVDHNEKGQAVEGLAEADILEIIDHHRLGGPETMSPVYFRNQPVGCTATIVYQMFCENGLQPAPQIAGLLCAAILSDTLLFRSPTCTPLDRATAETLSRIAGIDTHAFADEMFEAGGNLSGKTAEEVFYQDFKVFESNGLRFGVGQGNFMSDHSRADAQELITPYLPDALKEHKLDMVCYMVTSIPGQFTDLLFCGKNAGAIIKGAFDIPDDSCPVHLEGVVSRKKQLIPSIISGIQKLEN